MSDTVKPYKAQGRTLGWKPKKWHRGSGRSGGFGLGLVLLGFGLYFGFDGAGYFLEARTPWRRWYLWGTT